MSDVSHAGLTVSDLDRSIWFYTELLGLEVRRRYVADPEVSQRMWQGTPGLTHLDAVMLRIPKSEQELQLLQPTGDFGECLQAAGHPLDIGAAHFGLAVDDLEAVVARLGEHGFKPLSGGIVRGSGATDGFRAACVPDPDGFVVELIQRSGRPDAVEVFIAVTVADLEQSLWYYRDVLGMEVLRRADGNTELAREMWHEPDIESVKLVVLKKPGLVQYLKLREVTGLNQSHVVRRQCDVGFSHMCLAVDDLANTVAELEPKGITPTSLVWGAGLTAQFVGNSHVPDPDGFDLELLQEP